MSESALQPAAPLVILCPARSFSSVVCAMLGQHPQTYGLPELHLFITDTVDDLLRYWKEKKSLVLTMPGGTIRPLSCKNCFPRASSPQRST